MSLAINPTVTTYTSRTPYLTVAEFQNAPTAVDSTNLIPGGTTEQNKNELANIIARASSAMDTYCRQVLAATLDVDPVRRWRVNAGGVMIVPLHRKPILEIDAISYGPSPSRMVVMTSAMAADLVIGESTIEIPVLSPVVTNGLIPSQNEFTAYAAGSKLLVQVSYVNGWPNTLLADSASASDTTITVTAAMGIYPGSTLMVYDDLTLGEQIQVAPSYVTGSTTLPLVSPLVSAHAAGVSVSALPPTIKEACIRTVASMIKSKGSSAIQMASTTRPGPSVPSDPAGPDWAKAKELLTDFRRAR